MKVLARRRTETMINPLLIAVLMCAAVAPDRASGSERWSFAVYLDDKRIGEHHFEITHVGEKVELHSTARFEVKFLYMSPYEYAHEARERRQGNCLERIEARTN